MNTRNSGDKSEVENLYKTAIGNLSKIKSDTPSTLPTSTPIKPPGSRSETADFLFTESGILNNSATLIPNDSADLEGITSQPVRDFSDITSKRQMVVAISKSKGPDGTMTHSNSLATLKYAVEAVPFFGGQNIPITYFIEGCEEAKSMLPPETESQFTKIIRTRIIGEARRTIQDQIFDTASQLTNFLRGGVWDNWQKKSTFYTFFFLRNY